MQRALLENESFVGLSVKKSNRKRKVRICCGGKKVHGEAKNFYSSTNQLPTYLKVMNLKE